MQDRLVTLIGGGGFIGRYLAGALLRRGARVRIVQRRPRDAWFIKPLGGVGMTQFVAGDVTRPDTIARAVEGSDVVVNLVAAFNGDVHAINVKGAQTVAQAASLAGATAFIQISAIGADAESPAVYGRSKAAAERAVRDTFAGATILRPSVVFGPEDQFLNRFAGMIAMGLPVPVLRGGTRFQPVYVGDVAEAGANAVFDRAAHGGKTYELGGPDVLTMLELHRWIAREIGRDPLFVELPDAIGGLIAGLGFLPGAPITADQWKMLKRDNVVAADALGLADLGVTPTPVASVAPGWLVRFRRQGRFGQLGKTA